MSVPSSTVKNQDQSAHKERLEELRNLHERIQQKLQQQELLIQKQDQQIRRDYKEMKKRLDAIEAKRYGAYREPATQKGGFSLYVSFLVAQLILLYVELYI